ncbi:MAG TPA: hypothetical protein VGS58_10705, partial [Candidatus Sulfopaludibacter sp.]|nr:hypothetical protein [Candidatus Sulfopaludibacter sp.]
MRPICLFAAAICAAGLAAAQGLNCDLSGYKPMDGLKAEMRNGGIELAWQGARGQELRAAFAVRDGQPVVAELAAR